MVRAYSTKEHALDQSKDAADATEEAGGHSLAKKAVSEALQGHSAKAAELHERLAAHHRSEAAKHPSEGGNERAHLGRGAGSEEYEKHMSAAALHHKAATSHGVRSDPVMRRAWGIKNTKPKPT
jgi:hypothetical protein